MQIEQLVTLQLTAAEWETTLHCWSIAAAQGHPIARALVQQATGAGPLPQAEAPMPQIDPAARARMEAEARALQQHTNVAPAAHLGADDEP